MPQFQYWYIYSSLDFQAELIKAPMSWLPEHECYEYSGQYCGPFKTVKEARAEAIAKARDDVRSFQSMVNELKCPPRLARK